ncbi:EamA family transporter RarD [Noviherbaspirillum sedimenti]|uniref:EamA family transporter RarD n=1 Tax=Noviherbaspirillum sedimenti TaxID=2320865 RepID=A0A3A3G461_9BURK|nr:EamA family transporter RarD [Noviherbaspirillum sedimenti]RJG02455.1 EamA family transporter RarD [Noviherbaspirillum sedimenti]
MNSGLLYAAVAYAVWGLFPLYFKAVQDVPPLQMLMHRAVWSMLFLVIVLMTRRQWAWLGRAVRDRKVLGCFVASALLLSLNWFVYIWAVNHGRVVDASLGYFITPLLNVLLGLLVLGERLRSLQWGAVGLAAAGVAWLTWHSGGLPWIGLLLAATFGIYGLLRKTAPLGALEGLTLETLLMFPAAALYLGWQSAAGANAFSGAPLSTQLLLAAAGPITAIPLLMFATGARRIPMSLLGLLQYISPTLQLLLGVALYDEPLGGARLLGFILIWGGLAIYSLEGLWRSRAGKTLGA